MKRKEFLKGLGLAGIGATIAPSLAFKDIMDEPSNNDLLACTASPSETAGPYPWPSTTISTLVRTNITEGTQTGVALSLTFTLINTDSSCATVPAGLRVDIWHCNKRGYYSAYAGQPGIDGTVNTSSESWLRGIQYTDSNGQVQFTTVYPGWYTPRATHIHVQVYQGTTLLLTTQLAFPDAINTAVNANYATSGTNSFTNTNDMVFSDSYTQELMTVTGSIAAGYVGTMNINVPGVTLGREDFEAETGGQFNKLNNFPNPYSTSTKISFNLVYNSDIKLTIFDVNGRKIEQHIKEKLTSGIHEIEVGSKIASGNYLYQLEVSNENGIYRQSKKMIKN